MPGEQPIQLKTEPLPNEDRPNIKQPDSLKLPKLVKVSKQIFYVIKSNVLNTKDNNLQARPKESQVININNSKKLLQNIKLSKLTYEEALKRIENIPSDIKKLVSVQSISPNQINVLNIIFMVNEIFIGESESIEMNGKGDLDIFKEKLNKEKQESDKQPDTIDMPELESKKSAVEGKSIDGKGLKILTPDQF